MATFYLLEQAFRSRARVSISTVNFSSVF